MEPPFSNVSLRNSSVDGLGVFAEAGFKPGERILPIDDSRLVTPEAPLRAELGESERHCDYLARGKVVLMQIPERHINHSCDPNAYVKTIEGVRYVLARRSIAGGEELTFDYCINGYGNTVWHCNCGSPQCRQMIHSDFFHLPLSLQRAYLPLLDDWYLEEYRKQVDHLRHSL